jgi:magnesium transporter
LYRAGALEASDFPLSELGARLEDEDVTVWVDLGSPAEADLRLVADELGLHELAVEDAVQSRQRPKVDQYDGSCYVTAYSVSLSAATVTTAELGVFLTARAVVTVRPDEAFDIDAVVSRWDDLSRLAGSGTAFLVHGLLDYVADTHLAVAQGLDDLVEEFEDQVFSERSGDASLQRHALELRRSVVTLRRVVLPMRDVVDAVSRRDVDPEVVPYFRDVYDHVLRAAEWTDSLRELLATVRETQLNVQSNRLNLIMKQVTGWAAIIAVPTAITGWYGQNVPFPGDGQMSGFVSSTVAIVVVGVALYVLFRRRDWL